MFKKNINIKVARKGILLCSIKEHKSNKFTIIENNRELTNLGLFSVLKKLILKALNYKN